MWVVLRNAKLMISKTTDENDNLGMYLACQHMTVHSFLKKY